MPGFHRPSHICRKTVLLIFIYVHIMYFHYAIMLNAFNDPLYWHNSWLHIMDSMCLMLPLTCECCEGLASICILFIIMLAFKPRGVS